MKTILSSLLAAAFVLSAAPAAFAQSTIKIEFRQTKGSRFAGGYERAIIALRHLATGVSLDRNSIGYHRPFEGVQPGTYRIAVYVKWGKKMGTRSHVTYRKVGHDETLKLVFIGEEMIESVGGRREEDDARRAAGRCDRRVVARILRKFKAKVDHEEAARTRLRQALPGFKRSIRGRLLDPSWLERYDHALNRAGSGKIAVERISRTTSDIKRLLEAKESQALKARNLKPDWGSLPLYAKQYRLLGKAVSTVYYDLAGHREVSERYRHKIKQLERILKSSLTAKDPRTPCYKRPKPKTKKKTIATALSPVPSGAYKDSGAGASENKRMVFSCKRDSSRKVSRCTANYSGTGDGAAARIEGNFTHKTYVLDGYWIESKSNSKCRKKRGDSFYWGRVRFVFQSNLKSWKGKWNYCGNPLKHSWNGAKFAK